MLLEGIVKNLPRTHFYVIVCSILTKPSHYLRNAADSVVELPLNQQLARTILGNLR